MLSIPVTEISNVRNNKPVIVLFFSHECFFCKKMKPDWEEFKKTSPINFSEVPSEEMFSYNKLDNESIIQGYPTIRLYNKGKFIKEYDGDRSQKDIMKFVKKYIKKEKAKQKNLLLVKSKNALSNNLVKKITKQRKKNEKKTKRTKKNKKKK